MHHHGQKATTRSLPRLAAAFLGLGVTGAAGYLLFLHLMQSSAPFAEAVAKASPALAETFACGCPLCSRACQGPTEAYTLDPEAGLSRFLAQ